MRNSVRRSLRPATALVLTGALVMAIMPAGCTDGKAVSIGSGKPLRIDYSESPADAAARLGKVLATANDAGAARPAVYEALARTGIAVKSVDGETLSPTGDRRLALWLFEEQANNLTLDLVEHQGWTLETFTQAIAEHPEGPGTALIEQAPEAFGVLLREWAAEAARSPDDPSAFAPLLLAEISRQRGGHSDFTSESMVPADVELTYLELMILTAGAFASEDAVATSWRDTPVGTAAARALDALAAPFTPEKAYAEDPCSFIKDTWGKDADNFGRKGLDKIWSMATGAAGDWLTSKGMGDLVGGMKSMAGPMKWANLLYSYISLYGGYSIVLKWEPSPVHYLGYDGEHGDQKLKVTATVSVRPQADDATLKCLKFAGIDKPTSDSIKNCRVEWIALSGIPKHATMDKLGGDRVAGAFVQAVDDGGNATLTLTMSNEKDKKDKDRGKLKKDVIVIQADVTTYKLDPSKMMSATLFGGTKGGVTEVMKGWINKWFPKRAVARIPVEYHEQNRWRGVIDDKNGLRIVFTSQQGLESIWDVAFEGAVGGEVPMTGKTQVDMKRDDAQVVLTGTGTYELDDEPVTLTVTYTFERASIGGTSEAPTLVLSGVYMDAKTTAEDGGGWAKGGGQGEFSLPLTPYNE